MAKAEDLYPIVSNVSRKFNVVVNSHASFFETGYNYLSSVRDRKPVKDQKKKYNEFMECLKEDIKLQNIKTSGDAEIKLLADDVLKKIATDFEIKLPQKAGKK
jgi:hypothetical protein